MSGTWASGWATNDVVSAAEYAKSMGSIFDTTLGAGAANIDVTGIVGSYAHLLVVGYLRSDSAVAGVDLITRFNGDSGANYGDIGAGTNNFSGFANTSLNFGANLVIAAASATAGVFSPFWMLLPHYAGTANFKAAWYASGNPVSTGTTHGAAGTWRNTAALNRITISASAGNLVTGSRLTIYAMGA